MKNNRKGIAGFVVIVWVVLAAAIGAKSIQQVKKYHAELRAEQRLQPPAKSRP